MSNQTADITVTVQLRAPLPVLLGDMPTLEQLVRQAASAHGVSPSEVTMRQDGSDLVLSYEVTR